MLRKIYISTAGIFSSSLSLLLLSFIIIFSSSVAFYGAYSTLLSQILLPFSIGTTLHDSLLYSRENSNCTRFSLKFLLARLTLILIILSIFCFSIDSYQNIFESEILSIVLIFTIVTTTTSYLNSVFIKNGLIVQSTFSTIIHSLTYLTIFSLLALTRKVDNVPQVLFYFALSNIPVIIYQIVNGYVHFERNKCEESKRSGDVDFTVTRYLNTFFILNHWTLLSSFILYFLSTLISNEEFGYFRLLFSMLTSVLVFFPFNPAIFLSSDEQNKATYSEKFTLYIRLGLAFISSFYALRALLYIFNLALSENPIVLFILEWGEVFVYYAVFRLFAIMRVVYKVHFSYLIMDIFIVAFLPVYVSNFCDDLQLTIVLGVLYLFYLVWNIFDLKLWKMPCFSVVLLCSVVDVFDLDIVGFNFVVVTLYFVIFYQLFVKSAVYLYANR